MRYYLSACFLGSALLLSPQVKADDTIYDIVNREDKKAFSDMVMLGYDIDEQDLDGYSPLMIAAASGKLDFVEYLIDNGAKVDKRYYQGGTALHRAALGGYNDVISVLLDAGANVNMPDLDGMTPLMMAVKNGKRFTVELLVKRGANVNFRNAKGETALDIANKYRYKEIAQYLEQSKGKFPETNEQEPEIEGLDDLGDYDYNF